MEIVAGTSFQSNEALAKALEAVSFRIEEADKFMEPTGEPLDQSSPRASIVAYYLKLNGDGYPCTKELAKLCYDSLLDYCIPRKQKEEAVEIAAKGSSSQLSELITEAKRLFKKAWTEKSDKTGEEGEVLLFLLATHFMKAPMLYSKMYTKENPNMPVFGSDGVYAQFIDGNLNILWGESKLYQNVTGGINDSIGSISKFLLPPEEGTPNLKDRGVNLIQSNIDLGKASVEVQKELLEFLKGKKKEGYARLSFEGICLVAFDYAKYTEVPVTQKKVEYQNRVKADVEKDMQSWINHLNEQVKKYPTLERYKLNVFFLPLDSTGKFATEFRNLLDL